MPSDGDDPQGRRTVGRVGARVELHLVVLAVAIGIDAGSRGRIVDAAKILNLPGLEWRPRRDVADFRVGADPVGAGGDQFDVIGADGVGLSD